MVKVIEITLQKNVLYDTPLPLLWLSFRWTYSFRMTQGYLTKLYKSLAFTQSNCSHYTTWLGSHFPCVLVKTSAQAWFGWGTVVGLKAMHQGWRSSSMSKSSHLASANLVNCMQAVQHQCTTCTCIAPRFNPHEMMESRSQWITIRKFLSCFDVNVRHLCCPSTCVVENVRQSDVSYSSMPIRAAAA